MNFFFLFIADKYKDKSIMFVSSMESNIDIIKVNVFHDIQGKST